MFALISPHEHWFAFAVFLVPSPPLQLLGVTYLEKWGLGEWVNFLCLGDDRIVKHLFLIYKGSWDFWKIIEEVAQDCFVKMWSNPYRGMPRVGVKKGCVIWSGGGSDLRTDFEFVEFWWVCLCIYSTFIRVNSVKETLSEIKKKI